MEVHLGHGMVHHQSENRGDDPAFRGTSCIMRWARMKQ